LTIYLGSGIIRRVPLTARSRGFLRTTWEVALETYLNLALIITSIALIVSVVLQSKGAGLGGLTGSDMGSFATTRRGLEKTLFNITIALSVIFFLLAIASVIVVG